jgi:hypothetical protein
MTGYKGAFGQHDTLGCAGNFWMFRRFTSAQAFLQAQVRLGRTLWVQAIAALPMMPYQRVAGSQFFARNVTSELHK